MANKRKSTTSTPKLSHEKVSTSSKKVFNSNDKKDTKFQKRNLFERIILQLGIRIHYLWLSCFLIKPLFFGTCSYPSKWRPKNAPQYDSITRIGFTWLWLIAGITRDRFSRIFYLIIAKTGILYLMNIIHQWLTYRLISQIEESGFQSNETDIPIPEYDWENGSPEEFHELFVKQAHPVVLRGFMKDKKLLKEIRFDSMIKKFGEEKVFLTSKEQDGYLGQLKDVNNPSVYLHNSEILFNKYPEIKDYFEYELLEPYLKMKVGYEQFFLGREGTGSPFHHAGVHNMFYMIEGKKKWSFVDPFDTYLAYPIPVFGVAAGILGVLWPGKGNMKDFPLFKYCPIYSTILEEGDVLYNPPWWWHAIENITSKSVAVASRWHTGGIAGHNYLMTEENYEIDRFSSMSFFLGLASWPFLHEILADPSPRFDEHITIREKNNRYVHNQLKINTEGGVTQLGIRSIM